VPNSKRETHPQVNANVSFLVHGAEMRVAETRAVNRALRKAYGIGICSVKPTAFPTPRFPANRGKYEVRHVRISHADEMAFFHVMA